MKDDYIKIKIKMFQLNAEEINSLKMSQKEVVNYYKNVYSFYLRK